MKIKIINNGTISVIDAELQQEKEHIYIYKYKDKFLALKKAKDFFILLSKNDFLKNDIDFENKDYYFYNYYLEKEKENKSNQNTYDDDFYKC